MPAASIRRPGPYQPGAMVPPARRPPVASLICAAALLLLLPAGLRAQPFEAVGTRALGLAGAFVAVADDATAPYWNPAGLWSGAWAEGRVDGSTTRATCGACSPARGIPLSGRETSLYMGFVVPSLGLTWLRSERTSVDGASGTEGTSSADRDNDRSQRVRLARLSTQQVGVTLVQSIVDRVALGATIRLVRGVAARGEGQVGRAQASADLLAEAGALRGKAGYAVDADVGAMVVFPGGRAGAAVRNVRGSGFEPPAGAPLRLPRQVRVGVALTPGRAHAPTASRAPGGWTVALDADLTRTAAPGGDWRTAAVGVERWMAGGRVGLRGGMRGSTAGAWRPVAAAGVSLALGSSLLVEAQATGGHRDGDRGWSVAGRATF